MKFAGIILTLCALTQAAIALPEQTLDLLCPMSADAKKTTALRTKLKTLEKGLDAADKKGKTALILAAEEGNRLAICYLVARGANVSLRDKSGKSAADYIRRAALRELLAACIDTTSGPAISHEQREREALANGLTTPESRQQQLRKLATTPGSLPDISTLLAMNVDLNATGADGKALVNLPGITPEYMAFFVRRGYNPAYKAQNSLPTLRGDMTAPMAQLLLALGVQPDTANAKEALWAALFADDVPALQALLAADKELINTRTEDDRPLLALAQSAGMVSALVKAGADAQEDGLVSSIISRAATDPRSAGALGAMIKAGAALPQDALPLLCRTGYADARSLHTLLSAGADATAADAEGNTPLHLLLIHNATPALLTDAVKTLLKAGANTKVKNNSGKSPEQLAKSMGREDLLKLMKKSAAKDK